MSQPQGGAFSKFFNRISDKLEDGILEDIIKMRKITKKVIQQLSITIGENIIATIQIRNNYGAIQSFIYPILR